MALPPRSGQSLSQIVFSGGAGLAPNFRIGTPTFSGGINQPGGYPIPTTTPLTRGSTGGGAGFPEFGGSGGFGWEDFFGELARRGTQYIGDRLFGNPSGGDGSGSVPGEGSTGCAPGYAWNPDTMQCEQTGTGGYVRRMLPGGMSGTQADIYGQATMGAFGIPALVPAVVGQIQDANGNVKPIQRCPPGAVLGKDNLCYMKGSIPVKFRKWRPAPKPPMSASDAKALRRIGTLQKKVKRLAGNAGLSCRKR